VLKLISLNIEKDNHYDTVLSFLDKEAADVICLQEVPESFIVHLLERNYLISFAPLAIFPHKNGDDKNGILIGSKFPVQSQTNYYHRSDENLVKYTKGNEANTLSLSYIMSSIETSAGIFNIATTHIIDTEAGKEDDVQVAIMNSMLAKLKKEPDHLICGDFNMPRGYNKLYEEVTKEYKDNIPKHYQSSLDRNLHRLGNVEIDEPIFDKFMVDYIFTKPPYVASDVRLEFGVSDHAAVVANIFREN
jgi:endonuclease/exonuclease/phosphatase family metal-dependent hydrolase